MVLKSPELEHLAGLTACKDLISDSARLIDRAQLALLINHQPRCHATSGVVAQRCSTKGGSGMH